jgi:hypothetical protein
VDIDYSVREIAHEQWDVDGGTDGVKRNDCSLHIYMNEVKNKTDNNAKINRHNYRRERVEIFTTLIAMLQLQAVSFCKSLL